MMNSEKLVEGWYRNVVFTRNCIFACKSFVYWVSLQIDPTDAEQTNVETWGFWVLHEMDSTYLEQTNVEVGSHESWRKHMKFCFCLCIISSVFDIMICGRLTQNKTEMEGKLCTEIIVGVEKHQSFAPAKGAAILFFHRKSPPNWHKKVETLPSAGQRRWWIRKLKNYHFDDLMWMWMSNKWFWWFLMMISLAPILLIHQNVTQKHKNLT